jgi:hypothetical protein
MLHRKVHSGIAVSCFQDFPIFSREQFGNPPPTIRVVFDNQYTRHGRRAVALLSKPNAKRWDRVGTAVLTVSRSDCVAHCRICRHLNRDRQMGRDKMRDHEFTHGCLLSGVRAQGLVPLVKIAHF